MDVEEGIDGAHIWYDLILTSDSFNKSNNIYNGFDSHCTIMNATGIPNEISITMRFRGLDSQGITRIGNYDHYPADVYMSLSNSDHCLQHGGYDHFIEGCTHKGDLGHKWWWRGETSTYIAKIHLKPTDILQVADEWKVCLGIGRTGTPHTYEISGAIALHSLSLTAGISSEELRRKLVHNASNNGNIEEKSSISTLLKKDENGDSHRDRDKDKDGNENRNGNVNGNRNGNGNGNGDKKVEEQTRSLIDFTKSFFGFGDWLL